MDLSFTNTIRDEVCKRFKNIMHSKWLFQIEERIEKSLQLKFWANAAGKDTTQVKKMKEINPI